MHLKLKTRTGVTIAVCAALGAAGGIVGSMAAPAKHRAKASQSTTTTTTAKKGGRRFGGRDRGGPPVHSEAVVLNKAGTAFITATEDSGTVKSVSGNDITITEARNGVTYKDVTVTLPSDATIDRNGAAAKVGDLKAGDEVHVSRSSDGTFVFAADSSFRPQRGRHHGPGGPGDPDGPDGPGDGPPPPPPAQG